MNFSNLLNEFSGSAGNHSNPVNTSGNPVTSGLPNTGISNLASKIPGGLVGGAVSGGLVALLVGNKSARKTVGKAAKYGGAAVLGGLAYKAYKSWQDNNNHANRNQAINASSQQTYASNPDHSAQGSANTQYSNGGLTHRNAGFSHQASNAATTNSNVQHLAPTHIPGFESEALEHSHGVQMRASFDLAIVKAMIAAARADGSIDQSEQRNISDAIAKMNLDSASRAELLELFIQPISIHEFASEARTVEQKAELYLASCLAINLDHEAEYAHLSNVSQVLNLPDGLEHQLRAQAKGALDASA